MSIIEYTGPSNPQEIRKYLMRRTKEEIIHEYLRQWRHSGELEKARDALAAQVDSLTGITEYTAPCVFHDNAHADCVQHSGQAPCMTQTEPEWLAEIQKERDALAALLAQVKNTLAAPMSMEWRINRAIDHLLSETPATSLARLIAEKQAETPDGYELAELVMDICGNPKGVSEAGQEELYEAALHYAKRRQAEGDEP